MTLHRSRSVHALLLLALLPASVACGKDGASTPVDEGAPDATTTDGGPIGTPDSGPTADAGADSAPPPAARASVLVQHNDLSRTGANLIETTLTTANVNATQFGKLFCRPVDDEIYTQPLIAADVDVPGKGRHDVLYVATMNDTVYAFDANDPTASDPLWTRSYLGANKVPPRNTDMVGSCGGKYTDISGNIGIVGTPVIDAATHTMYFVTRTKENGTTFVQALHAIDSIDGTERAGSPTIIEAEVPGNGEGGQTVTFNPLKNNQRSALLLHDGVVYIAWSSHCDWGPYHGWFLGYDAKTLQKVVTYNTTPDGNAGGIWMSGQGPAADADGNIYLATGNGNVGTPQNRSDVKSRGESFLRLRRSGATMSVASFFTPFDYQRLEDRDLDLGSAGLLLVPDTNYAVSGGKGGTFYVVDRTTMGGLNTAKNDSQIVQSMPITPGRHLHGSPVHWKGPDAAMVYSWAEYDHLKALRLDPKTAKLDPTPLALSTMTAPDGMPGAMLSISADGSKEGTGIVWANVPYFGDANQAVVMGMLRVFDAANVGVELWNSRINAARDDSGKFAKFTSPTVANGKVYLATFSKQVCAYGLLPSVTPLSAPTTLTASATTKSRAELAWVDTSTLETGFVVERKVAPLGFAPIATLPANTVSYSDTTVEPFGVYAYRVRATGAGAPSAYSNVAQITMNAGAPAPHLRVVGNGRLITAGATAPSDATGTDFGGIALNQTTTRTFTVENTGNAPLNLAGTVILGGASPQRFSVTAAPPTALGIGASATFRLAFTPTAPGPVLATADLGSDDPAQAHYTFAIGGAGIGDLVGWWKLDETAGQSVADTSGHVNTGIGQALTWVAAHSANGAQFNGTTSFVEIADTTALNPQRITIAAFVKPDDWTGNRRILQKGTGDDQFRLLAEDGLLKFDIAGVGTVTTALPVVASFTHVAATYDGAAIRLYINGVQAAAVAATAAMPVTTDPLYIGTKYDGAPGGDHFHGVLDEVRMYGRALSAAEIAVIAQ